LIVYHALVFDLDGTLVQTEQLKANSYGDAVRQLRPDIHPEEVEEAFKTVVGRSRQEVAAALLDRFRLQDAAQRRMDELGVNTPLQAFVQIRLKIYNQMLSDPEKLRQHRWPHAIELVALSQRAGLRRGLATMSDRDQTRTILDALNLAHSFNYVATRDDVERPKPDPEIYQLVIRHLDVSAPEALALEDSLTGVESALAADLHVFAVTTRFTRDSIHQSGLLPPDRIIDNHVELIPIFDHLLGGQQHAQGA
jgi:beta-phosphoglucomutase